jgi:hypothetical protein
MSKDEIEKKNTKWPKTKKKLTTKRMRIKLEIKKKNKRRFDIFGLKDAIEKKIQFHKRIKN